MLAVVNTSNADSVDASPQEPVRVGPIDVGASTVTVTLGNGAYGQVLLYSVPTNCAYAYQKATTECSTVILDLRTKGANGKNLYSDKRPVRVVLTCDSGDCPKVGRGAFDPVREYQRYPLKVSMKENGTYLPYRFARPCQKLSNDTDKGTITTSAAQDRKSTRLNSSH